MKKLALGSNTIIHGKGLPSKHAEESIIYKLRRLKQDGKINPRMKIDILVIKLTKTCKLSFSRPCKACIIRLERCGFNIRRVYYSNEFGGVTYESFNDLISVKGKFSRGTRAKNNKR